MFPARVRICLDCRVALTLGQGCTWLSHELASLAGDCEPLIARVWGAARAVDRAARLRDFYLSEDLPSPIMVRERDRPLGAATEPMVALNAVGFRGRIEEGPTTLVPLGKVHAVGFALEVLHHEAAGSPVMLRDGATLGFSVAGDDGRILLVPPGGVQMAAGGLATVDRNRRRIQAYLRQLAPASAEPSPFPCDEVHLALLVPGDLVTVRAVAAVRPDPRGRAGYREAPRSILMASGVPWVEHDA